MSVTAIRGDTQLQNNTLTNDSLTSRTNTLTLSTVSNGDIDLSPNGTGQIDATSHKIKNVTDPTSSQDAATKNYVDGLINGLSWKNPVLAATTGTLSTSFPGGYTATTTTLTENTPGDGSITPLDGVTLVVGSRVLVKDETGANAKNNGIYTVTTLGDGATVAWVLTRSSDMNTWTEVPSAATIVEEGTVNADKAYACTSDPGGTLGTTAITFVLFASISGGVTSITGTTNQIIASSATGAVTLSTPQDIATTSSPTFAGETLTTSLTLSNQASIIFKEQTGNGTDSVTLEAPNDVTTSYTLKWPAAQGGASTVLSNDGSGNLSWVSALTSTLTSAHLFVGNGSNVATDTAITGDVTISNTGVTTIGAGKVTFADSRVVVREVPSGSINSSNVTFTLANTPASGSEEVYLNGLLQNVGGGNDYTISSGTITFNNAPSTGSVLLVTYWKS